MDNSTELRQWLEALNASPKPIIVEGIKDKAALVKLGIKAERIKTLSKPLFAVAEDIAKNSKKAIILTDLDPEGKKLYMTLKRDLTRQGVEIDNKFREQLFRLSKLSHIEGIDTYFSKL